MFKNLNLLCRFIAHKLVQYVTEHNPEYIASHKLFTEANVQGELFEYLSNIIVFVLIPLLIIVVAKLIYRRRIRAGKETPFFSKKAKIVLAVALVGIAVIPVATFIVGFKPQEFPDGMKMEYLEYQPGNQPITDEIVDYAAENVVPEIVEAGEKALEVLSDPKTSNELVKEMTGVNPNEITKDLSKIQ